MFIGILSVFLRLALALTVNEPPDGKLYLAAWLDTVDTSVGAFDGDRPFRFNQRFGYNASAFQYAQNMPLGSTFAFPVEQIEVLDTDTIIYLTVYPQPNPWDINDADIRNLTRALGTLNSQNRRVLLRFAPEMNGNWNYWGKMHVNRGMKPTLFLSLWRRVFTALREDAPTTVHFSLPRQWFGLPALEMDILMVLKTLQKFSLHKILHFLIPMGTVNLTKQTIPTVHFTLEMNMLTGLELQYIIMECDGLGRIILSLLQESL
jgi:hypothetical protein